MPCLFQTQMPWQQNKTLTTGLPPNHGPSVDNSKDLAVEVTQVTGGSLREATV
jgi:hypothetical protein